eukprot:m.11836 g.11836  ORF g.11836 m.11836 type:complete len:267 (+) comp2669_c0_seq1:56-856(+)
MAAAASPADLAEMIRTIYLEGVALSYTPDDGAAKDKYFSLCQRAIVEAELIKQEIDVRIQQHTLGREEAESANERTRAHQDRIKFLERQLERARMRGDVLQTQLDDVHKVRIATNTRLAGGFERSEAREPSAAGDATAQVLDLQRKLRAALGDAADAREAMRTLSKENERLTARQLAIEREAARVQDQLRIDRDGRTDATERLRIRVRELEEQLRQACAAQVRQRQQEKLERQRKMWEALEKRTADCRIDSGLADLRTSRKLPTPP